MSLERWERSREKRKKKAKARLLARNAAGLPRHLSQFDNEDEAPERGYYELHCECGRVVFAPRQASVCTACAKAKRAKHMREVRAKAKQPTDFGECVVCKETLNYDAKRSTRKYCSSECRQSAYRARLKQAARRARPRRGARRGK